MRRQPHLNPGKGRGAGGEACDAAGKHWVGRQADGALACAQQGVRQLMKQAGAVDLTFDMILYEAFYTKLLHRVHWKRQ